MPALFSQTPFVGRERELARLRAAFDDATAGHGSLVMVVGEPGIGKTALCDQLRAAIASQGGRLLSGHRSEERALSRPYLPFVETLRHLRPRSRPE